MAGAACRGLRWRGSAFVRGAVLRAQLPGDQGGTVKRRRPTVFASPKSSFPSGTPVSLSDQLARVDGFSQTRPDTLTEGLYAHPTLPQDQRQDCLAKILNRIGSENGIQFRGHDADRIGNFEIFKYSVGSYDQPDGLMHRHVAPRPGGGAGVIVWVEPPLAGHAPFHVGCRLFNGHTRELRTLVPAQLQQWPAGRMVPLEFSAAEPISAL
jgi:hypothetical protein